MDTTTREAIQAAIAAGQKLSDEALIKIGRKAVAFVLAHKHAETVFDAGIKDVDKLKESMQRDPNSIGAERVVAMFDHMHSADKARREAKTALTALITTVDALID